MIRELWQDFIQYGYTTRSTQSCGFTAWTIAKKHIVAIDTPFSSWNNLSIDIFPVLKNNLKLFGDTIMVDGVETNDHSDHTIWEPHHFLLQHGRIVAKNTPTIQRLLQIAYNAGQLYAMRAINAYTDGHMAFYDDTELNHVDTYISQADHNTLNGWLAKRSDAVKALKYALT